MNNSSEISLKDAVSFVVDNRGKTVPVQNTGIPLISTACISNKALYPSIETERYVSNEIFRNWFRSHPEPGDIILTNKGSKNGEVCLVPDPVDFCIAQDMVALRANSDLISHAYLFAALRSQLVQARIKALNVDAVIPHFKKTDFDRLLIPLPSRQNQDFIGNFYLDITKKIELNQKTNETLESIAKALFKSWFVDFDPVRTKAERRSTGLPDEIGKLFPDSFEDSELGQIPNGWICRPLRSLISPVTERQGDKEMDEYSATVTGIEPRESRFKKSLSKSNSKNRVALEGDLVFGLSRRVINFGRMNTSEGAFSPVYEVFRAKPGAPISTKSIERQIRLRMSEFMIILKPAAREGQAIDREVLLDQLVLIDREETSSAYEAFADLIDSRIHLIHRETSVLSQIRDALLPRLMSGELRIPDAEKILKEVGI